MLPSTLAGLSTVGAAADAVVGYEVYEGEEEEELEEGEGPSALAATAHLNSLGDEEFRNVRIIPTVCCCNVMQFNAGLAATCWETGDLPGGS